MVRQWRAYSFFKQCQKTIYMADTAVFIDGGFFDKLLDHLFPPIIDKKTGNEYFRLDYEKFANDLCKESNGNRLRTYYYHCKPIDDGSDYYRSKSAFYKGLIRTPRFQFREGKLSKHKMICKNKNCKSHLFCKKCLLVGNL